MYLQHSTFAGLTPVSAGVAVGLVSELLLCLRLHALVFRAYVFAVNWILLTREKTFGRNNHGVSKQTKRKTSQ